MKPTPLLDFWQKPAEAGAPVALFATTFALDPDFFEQNCLARFLEVSSVDEGNGSIDDIVAHMELHELLQTTRVTVLADRSAPVQRTSLLWDLLSCKVDGGLLHAKVSVLIWEKATRVILGSANLTAAGYRRQIELSLAADLGPQCLFPADVLRQLARELESYLDLVPGKDTSAAVIGRARGTLSIFKERIALSAIEQSSVRVAFAPTNNKSRPLDRLEGAWRGLKPLHATHLSPFWDSDDTSALTAAKGLLTGQSAEKRSQSVAVVLGPFGQNTFSKVLTEFIETSGNGKVRQLKKEDQEFRLLHAKCLLVESDQWVAALVGSSNHTKAGLGLTRNRHREVNVWLGAKRNSKEGKALRELIQLDKAVSTNIEEIESKDEDETGLPGLPTCFGLCLVVQQPEMSSWVLQLGIDATDMPADWAITPTRDRDSPAFLTRLQWEECGAPGTTVISLDQKSLPMFVNVKWDGHDTPWAVIADNPQGLPPGPMLKSLRAEQLLEALATGMSLSQLLRKHLELEEPKRKKAEKTPQDVLDPLKRLEVQGALLRKGRALGASLSAMQRRLERPVTTLEALSARLSGPLGPTFVASKITEAFEAEEMTRADALFTIAEVALTIGRVKWTQLLMPRDREEGLKLVREHLGAIDILRQRTGERNDDLSAYSCRAIEGAQAWLVA